MLWVLTAALAGQVVVPAGTIGTASLVASDARAQKLRLVFPTVTSRDGKGTVTAAGTLVLFDHLGVLARIDPPAGAFKMWCENDGGDHYRAELVVPVPRLARPLVKAVQDENNEPVVALVAVAGPALAPLASVGKPLPFLSGDLDGDGKPEAVVARRESVPGCGPALDLQGLVLTTAKGSFDLRCCGP